MNAYRAALRRYLEPEDRTQERLAEKVRCSQAAINRYVNGARFPDAATARRIAEATDGEVSFDIWQEVATSRLLGEAA